MKKPEREKNYILAVDEGTSGVRSVLFDRNMNCVSHAYAKVTSFYPEVFAVEQDPAEIYEKTLAVMREAVKKAGVPAEAIAGIGITAQRGTWTAWNKHTGKPVRPFLVWTDSRGRHLAEQYLNDKEFCEKYPQIVEQIEFSRFHMPLILEYLYTKEPGLKERLKHPDIIGGTIDTWLIYNLTGKKAHVTSISATSTTTFYTPVHEDWDGDVLQRFDIRPELMPALKNEDEFLGVLDESVLGAPVPICGNIGDQQAAALSEGCVTRGAAKCTIGTGFFLDVNTGDSLLKAPGKQSAICWDIGGRRQYFIDGYIPVAGVVFDWLKDNLKLIDHFSELETVLSAESDNGGVYFVPALSSLMSVPFCDPALQGSFMGITAATDRNHLIRAAVEGVVFISAHVFLDTIRYTGKLESVKINGGISKLDFVCQLLSNLTDTRIIRDTTVEAASRGAAAVAAIHLGWFTLDEAAARFAATETDRIFMPDERRREDQERFRWWRKALKRSEKWSDPSDLE